MIDKKIIEDRVDEINRIIAQYLPEADGYNNELCEAVSYSVTAGGKRLRPLIIQETFRMFSPGKDEPEILHAMMAAMEFIHTYSLVHDDLPAMDNDEYRRGQLTAHAKYGEAAGILTGDALLTLAFEIMLSSLENCDDPEYYLAGISAARVMASKAGYSGMAGGQYVDVYSEKHPDFNVDADCLKYIYKNKTSALIEGSFMIGAILGQAHDIEIDLIEKAGRNIGMAFQIRDDILDIEGNQELLGKPVGSDCRNNKQTYVTIYGMDQAKEAVKKYSDEALQIFDSLRCRNPFLREVIIELISREK